MIRIVRVQVTAFRGLRNLDVELQASAERALTVVLGPNESGKSSLLDFIREVLFGTGEAHGSVVLESDGHRYRMTAGGRRARQVVNLTTGETCPPGTARTLLGGIDAQVFQNVFAFGLTELQTLSSLTSHGVQERIFAAGVAGAGPSARAAVTTLERETQEYLRPRAQARLTESARAYEELRRLLRSAQAQAGQYQEWTLERTALQGQLAFGQQRVAGLEVRRQDLVTLRGLWPRWVDRLQAQDALDQLKEPPADSVMVLPELRELLRQHRELEQQRAGLRGELSALPDAHPRLEESAEELEALSVELAAHEERLGVLRQRQQEVAAGREEVDRQRRELVAAWTLDALAAFRAGDLQPLLEEAALQLTQAQLQQVETQRQGHDLERELHLTQAVLDGFPAVSAVDQPASTEEEALARAALEEAQRRWQSAADGLAGLNSNPALLSAWPALRDLLDQAPLAALTELPRQKLEIQRQQQQLELRLTELGDGWTGERLEAHRPEEEHGWRTEAQRQARLQNDLLRTHEEAGRTLLAREQAVHESEVRLRGWREVPDTARLEAELHSLQERQAQAVAVRTRFQGEGSVVPARPGSPSATGWSLWLGLALTLVLTVSAWAIHPLLSFLTLACGLALTFGQRIRPAAPRLEPRDPPRTRVVEADLTALGLPKDTDLSHVAALESELNAQLAALNRSLDLASQRDDAQRRLDADQLLLLEARETLRNAQSRCEDADRTFALWTAEQGLQVQRPDELGPFLLRLTPTRDMVIQQRGLVQRRDQMAEEVLRFYTRSVEVLSALDRAPSAEEVLPVLRQTLVEAEEARHVAARRLDAFEVLSARQADVERETTHLKTVRARLTQQHALALERWERLDRLKPAQEASAARAAEALRNAERDWHQLLTVHQLPLQSPAEIQVLMERLRRAGDAARALNAHVAQVALLVQQTESFQQRCRKTLQFATEAEVTGPAEEWIRPLAQQARLSGQVRERRNQLTLKLSSSEEQCQQAALAVAEILERCGAESAEQVESWEEIRDQTKALRDTIHQVDRDLYLLAGKRASEIRVELELARPEVWDGDFVEVGDQLEQERAQQDRRQYQLATLEIEQARLAASADSARVQLHLEAHLTELKQDIRTWLVRRLAVEVLSSTLSEYERTKGPEVLRHASEVFARITDGRYLAVRQVQGTSTFRAVTSGDDLVDVQHLSRGTQEQLYLAIRLGLARTLGERTAQLPLLMDDILVNADPERASAVATTIAEVARNHQVVFLTCHPESAERLGSALGGSAQVLNLSRLSAHHSSVASGATLSEATTSLHEYLAELAEPVGMIELERALAPLSQGEIRAQLRALEEAGIVVRSGQKRGTRYGLSSQGAESPVSL